MFCFRPFTIFAVAALYAATAAALSPKITENSDKNDLTSQPAEIENGSINQNSAQSKAITYFEGKLSAEVGPYDVKEFIDSKARGDRSDDIVIDVRAKEDFNKGHIPGAINIPQGKSDNLREKVSAKGVNYIYCYNNTCHLAARVAVDWLKENISAKEMVGGFAAWKENNYPIETKEQGKKRG